MKIAIAVDSYKGCCSSKEVAVAVERGFRKIYGNVITVKIPIADGGEGTVDTLVNGLDGKFNSVRVLDPLGREIDSRYGILPDGSAVIEMAAASGLPLLKPEEYDPLHTTTFGTGQLMLDAINQGCKRIYIGLGGSATNDGGAGMAQALGAKLMDAGGNQVGFGGGELSKIESIDIHDLDARISETEIIILSDVTCPLCGPTGASAVFGPQKGATPSMVSVLDENLRHFGKKIEEHLGREVADVPGAGAAGGLGASMLAFCNVAIRSGVDEILKILSVDALIKDVDLVITGEGRIDAQTVFGKVPVGIAKIAKKYDLPVVAIVGSIGEGAEAVYHSGIDVIMDIIDRPMALQEALDSGVDLIERCATTLARTLAIGKKLESKMS